MNSFILFLGAGDKLITLPNGNNLDLKNIYYGNVLLGGDILFESKKDIRLKIGNTLHHQALLIPKQMHIKGPFNTAFKVYADFDFNQRLLKTGAVFIKLENLQSYVLPDGFSQHYKTFEWFYIIKANFGFFYALLGYMYFYFQKLKAIIK